MHCKNQTQKEALVNARNSLLRAQVYCQVIKELFIFLGCKPFSEDFLNDILENDIRKFILRQERKLNKILKEEAQIQ